MSAPVIVATTAATAAQTASGYRVKFRKGEFVELVRQLKPARLYRRGKNHFFAADGFMLYTQECSDRDFAVPVIEAIELSNEQWST